MLDRQAPNVQIITNTRDDIEHKAPMHTNTHAQTQKHKRNLVHAVHAQRARPPQRSQPNPPQLVLQKRTHGVDDAPQQRQDQDVVEDVREGIFNQVRGDHLADGVGVDEADVEGERDEMVPQDDGVEREVERDEGPGDEEGNEAPEGVVVAVLAVDGAIAAGGEDVLRAGNR